MWDSVVNLSECYGGVQMCAFLLDHLKHIINIIIYSF